MSNMNLLCRLNIEFVCEISDGRRETSRRSYDCPCLCPKKSQHFRYFMGVDVPEKEQDCVDRFLQGKIRMHDLFDQFVELTQKGEKAGKCVLVCSAKGRNRAPAFAAAYMISVKRMTRMAAVAKVKEAMNTMRPPVAISDFMQRSLMRYQASKGIESNSGLEVGNPNSPFTINRAAWT
ncbi:hypothetical protein WR25_17732 [Diploscapter pachys]|uniref:Tyrosine-protein phosphatase domain-containing protein n=1 Tax=Diploscapter pachys TaxID=2018661 RepID=A0A2A2LPQ3_9BILA|nr:hypothetical protein WR25_17732 [Diploscapter pachys]